MLLLFAFLALVSVWNVSNADTSSSESAELADVIEDFYEWRLKTWPEYGTKYGINTYNTRIDDYTEEGFLHQKNNASKFLEVVQGINTAPLTQQQRYSKAILEDMLHKFIDGYEFRVHGMYNSIAFIDHPIYEWGRMIRSMPKATNQDFENILVRYRAIPEQLRQRIELMRKAIALNITGHRYDVENGLDSIIEEINASSADSTFYAVFQDNVIPETLHKIKLQVDCQDTINNMIRPALINFRDFLMNEYIPRLRSEPGVWSLPDGERFYQACLRWHLGPDVTAEEVHQLGLSEVSRIKMKTEELIAELGFNFTMREYVAYLRTQPDQYYNTSEEILQGYEEIISRVHDELPLLFSHVPEVPIKVIPSRNAVSHYSGPVQKGEPGTFFAYVKYPQYVEKFDMVALTLHEAEPGHHTQQIYGESEDIPDFRKKPEYLRYCSIPFNWPFQTAYGEGWALYAEYLGEALGSFDQDPTSLVGRYLSEIFRAARLVVDTGMHAKRWSFEKAVDYFRNNTGLSDHRVYTGLKRYVGWPGQACAYKYGELKIRELRRRAEIAFGDRFSIKEFHHQVLSLGGVPLWILEQHIDAWIAESTASSASTITLKRTQYTIFLLFLLALLYYDR